MRVIDGWYEMEEDGYRRPTPVLHFHGRSAAPDREYIHWSVDDFRPYFFVGVDDVSPAKADALEADRRVISVSAAERTGVDQAERDIPLLRVETVAPYHVAELRDEFPRTWEADVLFPQRWLIDVGVTSLVRLPDSEDTMVSTDAVEAVDAMNEDEFVPPRVAHWDIEVLHDGEFPEVNAPRDPINGVTLFDSETEQYRTIVLRGDHPDWDAVGSRPSVRVVGSERELLQSVIEWFTVVSPDILTGWNSNSFDWPYFVNRCHYLDVTSLSRISPTGDVDRHESDGRFVNNDVSGLHLFDLLDGYKKSQYGRLDSYSLDAVAAEETDKPKLDVDEQAAYRNDPQSFVDYSVRDVKATVAINNEVGLL